MIARDIIARCPTALILALRPPQSDRCAMLVLDKSESVHECFNTLPSDLVPNVKLEVKIELNKSAQLDWTYLGQEVAFFDVVFLVLVDNLLARFLVNALAVLFVADEELLA